MTIQEQIDRLRMRANDSYGGFLPAKQCGEVADTMEKLLAVQQAAIELSNELQGWQDFELAEVGGWINTRCLENKHQLMLDAIETLS